jgi:predicted TIM-barrel fold metal-dependent hydrolase
MGSAKLAGDRPPRPVVDPALSEMPSFYIKRQIHSTFQDDAVGLNNINLTGTDCLLWGSDYPHEEGTYPKSRETVDRLTSGLKDEDAADIFRNNAARIFNFPAEVLASPT